MKTQAALEIIAKELDTTVAKIRYQSRCGNYPRNRQIAAYVIKRVFSDLSLKEIASILNVGHHTTVIHSIKRIEDTPSLERVADEIIEKIKSMKSDGVIFTYGDNATVGGIYKMQIV